MKRMTKQQKIEAAKEKETWRSIFASWHAAKQVDHYVFHKGIFSLIFESLNTFAFGLLVGFAMGLLVVITISYLSGG